MTATIDQFDIEVIKQIASGEIDSQKMGEKYKKANLSALVIDLHNKNKRLINSRKNKTKENKNLINKNKNLSDKNKEVARMSEVIYNGASIRAIKLLSDGVDLAVVAKNLNAHEDLLKPYTIGVLSEKIETLEIENKKLKDTILNLNNEVKKIKPMVDGANRLAAERSTWIKKLRRAGINV